MTLHICSIIYHHGALHSKQLPNNKTGKTKIVSYTIKNRHASNKQIRNGEMEKAEEK
jgi:hypothetical protein